MCMKNIRMIIIAMVMSILMIGITNAYVESKEYVTHNDWKKMVASMSEKLDYLSEQYIQGLCAENSRLKEIHDRAEAQHKDGGTK